MDSFIKNNICIKTLSPESGIMIWYAKIPEIIQSIFKKKVRPDFSALSNVLIKKEDLITSILSDEEINTINQFKAVKKQKEWISGRWLMKHLIQHLLRSNAFIDQISLSYFDQGAPFVSTHPNLSISLSHSNDYTAVACCKNENQTLGIDIEKITKKPDAHFLKIAFTKHEILNLENNASQIFKNWTIKEAYLKYIRKGFNESLQRVEVINNDIFHNCKKIDVNVFSTFIDHDYVLSFVSD